MADLYGVCHRHLLAMMRSFIYLEVMAKLQSLNYQFCYRNDSPGVLAKENPTEYLKHSMSCSRNIKVQLIRKNLNHGGNQNRTFNIVLKQLCREVPAGVTP